MLHNLLQSEFFRPPRESANLSWIFFGTSILLLLLIQLFGNPALDIAGLLVLGLGVYYYDLNFLTPNGYQLNLNIWSCGYAISRPTRIKT